ncbi:DUF833-domain-containing protein [Thelephora ganbajun]|uniref:DUF833-domain-containing protein n=1 Tax=Thelephora ganbajun TaxID=370292 RepID=A0ACB6Z3W7_THEGA|nr:DUF833-domain-containing protein [Thelephora ganbajun]
MCIGTFSVEHPDYALILAANRDEVLNRPTEHARFRRSFNDHVETTGHAEADILCGLDLQAGGTWLGLNKTSGCVIFLTNITESYKTYELSRGYLVSSLLLPSLSGNSIKEEIQNLLDLKSRFAGFNLLVFIPQVSKSESDGLWRLSYEVTKLSNNGGGNPITSRTLTSEERKGGAMSNGIDGKGGDEWPKVKDATRSLREVLKDDSERTEGPNPSRRSDEELAEELFGILSLCHHESPNIRYELRNTIQVVPFALSPQDTGNAESTKQALHDSCPRAAYGTMLSTVILVKRNGEALFVERNIWGHGPDDIPAKSTDRSTDRVFRFKLAIIPPSS